MQMPGLSHLLYISHCWSEALDCEGVRAIRIPSIPGCLHEWPKSHFVQVHTLILSA